MDSDMTARQAAEELADGPEEVERLAAELEAQQESPEPSMPDDPEAVRRWVARLEDADPVGAAEVASEDDPEPVDLEDLSPHDVRKWHEALGRGELRSFEREHNNKER